MSYGLEIRVPGVSYKTKVQGFPRRVKQNISEVTIQENLPYMGTSIQMAPSFQPLFAENDAIEWSITDGSTYASINSSTGELTIKEGTITQMVKVKAKSRHNASIFDEKEIVLTYKELPEIENQSFQIIVEDLQQQYDFVSDDIGYTIKAYMLPDNTDYLSFNVLQNTDCDFDIPRWDADNKLLIQFRLKGEQRTDTTTTVRIYSKDDNLFYRDISFNVHIPFVITTSNLSRDAYYGVDTSFTYDSSPKFEQYLDTSLSVQILNDMNDVSWGYVNSSDGLSGIVNLQYNNTLNRDITFRITNSSLGVYTDKVVQGLFVQNVNLTYDGENTYFYKTRTDVPWGQPGTKYTDNRDTVYSFNIGTQPNLNRSMHVEVVNDASLINVLQVENVYNTDNLVSGLTVSFKLVSPSGNCNEYGTVKFRVYDDTGYLNDTQSIKFFIIPKSDEVQKVMTINTPYLDSSLHDGTAGRFFDQAYIGKARIFKTYDTSVLYEVEDGIIQAEKDLKSIYGNISKLLYYNTLKDVSNNSHHYGPRLTDATEEYYSVQQLIDKMDYNAFDPTSDYVNRRYKYYPMVEQYPPIKLTFTVYPNVRREMEVTALTNGIKDLSTYIEYDSSTRMTAHIEFYLIPRQELKYENNQQYKKYNNEIIRIQDSLNSSKYIDFNVFDAFENIQSDYWYEDNYTGRINSYYKFTNNIPIIEEHQNYIEYTDNYSYDYLYCIYKPMGPDEYKKITKIKIFGNTYSKYNDWPFETINIPWKYENIDNKSMVNYLTRNLNKVCKYNRHSDIYDRRLSVITENNVYDIMEPLLYGDDIDRYKESYIGRIQIPDTHKVSNYINLTDNKPLQIELDNGWVEEFGQFREIMGNHIVLKTPLIVIQNFDFIFDYDYEPSFYYYSGSVSENERLLQRYAFLTKIKVGNGEWKESSDHDNLCDFKTIYFDINNRQKQTIKLKGNILSWFAAEEPSDQNEYGLDFWNSGEPYTSSIRSKISHNQNITYSPSQFYNTFVDKIQGLPGWNTLIAKITNNPTNVTIEDRVYKSGLITVDYTGIIWPLIVE